MRTANSIGYYDLGTTTLLTSFTTPLTATVGTQVKIMTLRLRNMFMQFNLTIAKLT